MILNILEVLIFEFVWSLATLRIVKLELLIFANKKKVFSVLSIFFWIKSRFFEAKTFGSTVRELSLLGDSYL